MKCLLMPLFAVVLVASAAEPRITNRAAAPDEIGYRPADGTLARFNPPSLTWLHENGAGAYVVQWSRGRDFSEATTVPGLPFNTYTHNEGLAPGEYFWRYAIEPRSGTQREWSLVRTFKVGPESIPFPMPNRAQQRQRVPQSHPRLFLRPEELGRLRAAATNASTPASVQFARLKAAADKLLQGEPTPEPTVRGSNRDDATRSAWWPNRVQTEKACMEAETLAFVYLMTGEARYGQAARKWVLHLAGWDPDGPTNFKLNCEAAKPLLFRLPRAYDWAYDTLSEPDRERVRAVMLRRCRDAWDSGEIGKGVGHLNRPFNSHGNRVFHKLGEAAIAFLGEIPEAETWLDYAVSKFYAAYPVWADDDGGWHEGASYWAGYMSKIVAWLQVANSALEIDGFKKPFFAEVGDFLLYVAPPGSPNMGFGDLSFTTPSRGTGAFMEYFLRAMGSRPEGTRAGYWRWWTDQWRMSHAVGILGFLYEANLPPLPAAKAPSDLPASKVFDGIGVASLHTTLTDSADDVHLLFKASPFGTQSHGHNAQNTFQLNAYGEALLTSCVYRDYHGSKFHYEWCHSTRAQNGVLVDGEGQMKHSARSLGEIADSGFSSGFDYVVGDATLAYGGRLKSYRRSIAFVKPSLIVICDELVATNRATFQFMLHALAPFQLNEATSQLRLERKQAGVNIRYLSPVPLLFRQWDGYDPKPQKDFPNQWHVEAGTGEKLPQMHMLTVLSPYRCADRTTGKAPEPVLERLETATAVGVRVQESGRCLTVGFRKRSPAGGAELPGLKLEKTVGLAIEKTKDTNAH